MIIGDLEFYLVEVPRQHEPPVRRLLVRIATHSGLEGWGETSALWRADQLPARRETLLPALAGRSAFDVEELVRFEVLRDPALRLGVEMACWDVIGRMTSQPLCRLWGGQYRRRIPIIERLGGRAEAVSASQAREWAERGFHRQMLVARGSLPEDIAMIEAVANAVAGRAEVYVDGCSQYVQETARELAAACEANDITMLVDPIAHGSAGELSRLARQVRVPIAAGRCIASPEDCLSVVKSGPISRAVLNPECIGGLARTSQCAVIAQAAHMLTMAASPASLGVTTAAALQLACCVPAFSLGIDTAAHQLDADVIVERWEATDGMLAVPQGPGLGVHVDRGRLERYQVS